MFYESFSITELRKLSLDEIDKRFLVFINRIDLLIKSGILKRNKKDNLYINIDPGGVKI